MKIAHVVCTYPPYKGGMGNSAQFMVENLIERGHEVKVITPDFGNADTSSDPPYVIRMKTIFKWGNSAVLSIFKLHKELEGMDLVHLHYPFMGTDINVKSWKVVNNKTPLVISYHMDNRGGGIKGLIYLYYRMVILYFVLRRGDAVIASSFDYLKESDAKTFYDWHPDKCVEIPFSVDTDRFSPGPKSEELQKRYSLERDKKTIVFVGGMDKSHHFKGVDVLFDACKLLTDRNEEYQVLMCGSGDLQNSYKKKAKSLGIEKNIVWTGKVSDEELPDHYRLGDVFVLPSTSRSEAFGIVLIEAAACGVPVLASDLPGVRTVAKAAGQTFPVGDFKNLADLIQKMPVGESLNVERKRVRKVVEGNYAKEPVMDALERVYKHLVH